MGAVTVYADAPLNLVESPQVKTGSPLRTMMESVYVFANELELTVNSMKVPAFTPVKPKFVKVTIPLTAVADSP